MPDLQPYFEQFHDKIRLDFDDSQPLRDKRDIILRKLEERIEKVFREKGESAPAFTYFNQGSYAMATGVRPPAGDYDIDVGITFDVSKDDYEDPVEVKQWVLDALNGHTSSVEMRRPCVTVTYQRSGEPVYHVDLAIYSSPERNADGKRYLARGKRTSGEEYREWEVSNPTELISVVRKAHEGKDRDQFRRVVRYLKRWRDVTFAADGNAAPIGIGLTVAALYWFVPQKLLVNAFENKYVYRDLDALLSLVDNMLANFRLSIGHFFANRLQVDLPVEPGGDLFAKMTNKQMEDFKEKLASLKDVLEVARDQTDPKVACEMLREQFGEDFPVPAKETTAQVRSRAITSSSASG
jgi:hypothetical protein